MMLTQFWVFGDSRQVTVSSLVCGGVPDARCAAAGSAAMPAPRQSVAMIGTILVRKLITSSMLLLARRARALLVSVATLGPDPRYPG